MPSPRSSVTRRVAGLAIYSLAQFFGHPIIYVTAKLARRPAKAAGFGELQDFIMQTHKAAFLSPADLDLIVVHP